MTVPEIVAAIVCAVFAFVIAARNIPAEDRWPWSGPDNLQLDDPEQAGDGGYIWSD